ncbi:Transposon Ty3-I Gag-Pol polyprotein,Transposon Ty3-G Gag-Pol polyprotein [Mytilus coruscus]|uniref:Transposon Ty3-I Gag-Pol polyprotein,Transposon Ty3-G Gag-Pol polyprotein n=1 Tax=Mytilus coruscus TaxID=42192 RepID=A0A6J8A440_MYTCO|nr:Transposon Ty3-I Gag-Pol polyprotein,Transposon Ty3-G Gag-Pol polyprotein [Mytilus coruscus]
MQEPLEEIRRLHTSINMARPNQPQQNKNRYNKPRQNYRQGTGNQQQHQAFVPQQHYIPQQPAYNGQQYNQQMPAAVQNSYQQQQQQQDDGSCQNCEVNLVLPMQKNTSINDINGRKTHDTGAEITCCSFDFYSKLVLSDKLSKSDIPSIKGVPDKENADIPKVCMIQTTSTGVARTYYPVTISPFCEINVCVKISKRNSREIVLLEPEIHIPATKVLASVSDIDLNFIHDLDNNEPYVASLQQTNQVKEPINFDFSTSDLNSEQKQKMHTCLGSYRDIFATNLSELGFTNRYKHIIETFRDARPVKMRFYNQSPHMHKETEKHLVEMKKNNIIKESTKNVFDTLGEVQPQILSCLDLHSGFWQVEIDDETRHKFAFITRNGVYELLRMAFGLKNAPISFQQLMSNVLRGLNWQFVLVYVDDILVFSRSFEEHLSHLEQVFTRLRDLTLKPSKCVFAAKEVKYLGHIISKEGIKFDPEKTKTISTFPVPPRQKQVRSFLGMCNYYRRFVDSYSKIATPLNGLLKKEKERSFKWDRECQVAFDNLKQALLTPPVLAYPDMNKPFMLTCDASNSAIGFVLGQLDSQRKERYRKGCNNQVADALSRRSYPEQPADENEVAAVKVSGVNTGTEAIGKDRTSESIQVEFFYDDYTMVAPLDPVIARPELSNLPAIANLQQSCPDFGNIYKFLTQGILLADNDQSSKVQKSAQDYSICNSVLYKWFQKRVRVDNGEKWIKQLCLPQALREDALLSYHDSFVGGAHLEIERVFHALSLKYFWPRMNQSIENYIRSCDHCQRIKRDTKDLGRNFVSNLVNALCEMLNITRHYTSSYHPQTNGLVERTNSTLIQAVRAYSDKDQNNWPNKLPGILMAFRNSPSTQSTEYSPF